jgi:hypothetical protein
MLHLEQPPALRGKSAKAPPTLSGEIYGTLINLSGRRRFTSQRVVLYALLASQGRDGALAVSADALKTFADAHATLVEGTAQIPGVFCEELREAYFGALQGDKAIRDFIQLTQRTLQAVDSRARGAPALLDQLVESATPLLAVLNRITEIYEDLAKRQATLARKQLNGVMGDIESIAKHARIVSFNAQIVAARAGAPGREFAIVAGELAQITGQIDELVREGLRKSIA